MARQTASLQAARRGLFRGDISQEWLDAAIDRRVIAWDIETSGLDWRTDQIATCQLFAEGVGTAIVRVGSRRPSLLVGLLADPRIMKVFHHAMFDLRFMSHSWNCGVANIQCTKIAAKLLRPGSKLQTSLKPLLSHYLHIDLDKREQQSNWLVEHLSESQLLYAERDTLYLIPLLEVLRAELDSRGLLALAEACFAFIPRRVELDLRGSGDVFEY